MSPNKVLLLEEFQNKDNIPGGLADNLSVEDIASAHGVSKEHIEKQLELGIKVEMEHTNDMNMAEEIAKDHLVEDPNYYTHLNQSSAGNQIMTFENFSHQSEIERLARELLDAGGGQVPSEEECQDFYDMNEITDDSMKAAIEAKALEFLGDTTDGENFFESNAEGAQPEEIVGKPAPGPITPLAKPEPNRDGELTIDDLGDFDLPDNERLPLEEEPRPRPSQVGNHVPTFEQFKNS